MTAPTARALAGGALVACSIVLLFGLSGGTEDPPPSWVTASRAIPAGVVLTESDLAFSPMDLHDDTAAGALHDASVAIGAVTIGPLAPGDLLTRTRLTDATDTDHAPARRLTIEVPLADALGGEIAPPQTVDLVAVLPASATVIARGVTVLSVDKPESSGIGATNGVRLSLALQSETEAVEVIDARREGSIVLIASTPALGGATSQEADEE